VQKHRIETLVVGLRGRRDVCSCMIVCELGMVSNSQLCHSLSDGNSLSFTLVQDSFIYSFIYSLKHLVTMLLFHVIICYLILVYWLGRV